MYLKKSLVILFVSVLMLGQANLVYAQDEVDPSEIPTPTVVPTPAPVDYALPYPGLLPDHSLYFLKITRDRIMAFMISNPVKKAEFDLIQGDKRVQASYLLVMRGKNKAALAESTFSKGENYVEDAIAKANEAKKEGLDIHEVTKKLSLSNRKHLEVLEEIMKKLGKEESKQFEQDKRRVKDLEKKVKELRP